MKRFREVIKEGIDVDDGHEPVSVEPNQILGRRQGAGEISKLIAFHHQSLRRDRGLDHGHILRRPGEQAEDFFQRAVSVARKPFGGMSQGNPMADGQAGMRTPLQRTLEQHLSFNHHNYPLGIDMLRPHLGVPHPEVVAALGRHGCTVKDHDAGLATDKYGREVKIGRTLQRHGEHDALNRWAESRNGYDSTTHYLHPVYRS